MENQFDYINKAYRLEVQRGMIIVYDGKKCKVTGSAGNYIKARYLHNNKAIRLHPIWHVEYPKTNKLEAVKNLNQT